MVRTVTAGFTTEQIVVMETYKQGDTLVAMFFNCVRPGAANDLRGKEASRSGVPLAVEECF